MNPEGEVNMFKELTTERLQLKNIGYDDVQFMYEQFSNNFVNKYLFDMEPLKSIEEAQGIVRFYLESKPQLQHRWILVRKEDGQKIGTCGFHCWDKKNGIIEVGYDLLEIYTNQGYMSEAMEKMIEFARNELNIKRIDANIYIENRASIELVKKFGFTKTGEKYEHLYNLDHLHHIYSITLI